MKKILSLTILSILCAVTVFASDGTKQQAREYREEAYKLQSQGDLRAALEFYQKAIELDNKYFEAINDVGVVYEAMGQTETALTYYQSAVQIKPDYLPAVTNLAFYYESKPDPKQAAYFWRKRYDLGVKGEYWTEVAKQHLLALGAYPEIRKEQLEVQALKLSKDLVYKREQERLKTIEEAKLHFYIGTNLFLKGDYLAVIKEMETVLSINADDKDINRKAKEIVSKAKRAYAKEQALAFTQEALEYLKAEDFLSAGEKLKNALTATFQVAQEK